MNTPKENQRARSEKDFKVKQNAQGGYVFVAVALADKTLVAVFKNDQGIPPLGIVFNGALVLSAVSKNIKLPHQFKSRLFGNCRVKNTTITPITAPLSNALLST